MGRSFLVLLTLALVLGAARPARAEGLLELTLDEAIELGLSQSRELTVAEAKAQAADARLGQARSGFFPRLSGSGSYTRLDEAPYIDASSFGGAGRIYIGDDDIYTMGLSVTQPLFTGARSCRPTAPRSTRRGRRRWHMSGRSRRRAGASPAPISAWSRPARR